MFLKYEFCQKHVLPMSVKLDMSTKTNYIAYIYFIWNVIKNGGMMLNIQEDVYKYFIILYTTLYIN